MSVYEFLLTLDVENNWKQEKWVDWLSGKEIVNENNINKLDSWYTHCSAFLSAVCFKLNIPMLIPPEVRTEGLANKQCKWLNENGEKNNWTKITKEEIQNYCNDHIVVACQYSKDFPNCGHVAICVNVSNDEIYVCQAGKINSSHIKISDAFCHPERIEYWLYCKHNKKIEN
jgi:hypothetical protein